MKYLDFHLKENLIKDKLHFSEKNPGFLGLKWKKQCCQNKKYPTESISPHYASLGRRILFSRVRKVVSEMKRTIIYHKVWIKCKITQLLSWILNVTLYTLGGVKSACKDPSFAQSLVILQIRRGNFQNGLFWPNLYDLQLATSNSNNWGRSEVQNCTSDTP